MKVGDLICYNAAGMKRQTLGLVLDICDRKEYYNTNSTSKGKVLIQWCIVGEYMPRKDLPWGTDGYESPIVNGSVVWHSIGNWFEVIGE